MGKAGTLGTAGDSQEHRQTEKEREAASSSQLNRGLVEVVFKKGQVKAREAEAEVCCVCPEDNSMDGTKL